MMLLITIQYLKEPSRNVDCFVFPYDLKGTDERNMSRLNARITTMSAFVRQGGNIITGYQITPLPQTPLPDVLPPHSH